MCFVQPSAETCDSNIEDTMNEQIEEIVDLQLEVEEEQEMPFQLTRVAYGIHNLQDENLRSRIEAFFNEENEENSDQS